MRLRMLSGCGVALIAVACVPAALAGNAGDADSHSRASARAASCGGLAPTLKGSKGDDKGEDKLRGTGKQDVISAGRGNDLAIGRGGDDFLCGGPGKDVLKGGAGEDLCIGGPGRDKIRGCEAALVAPPASPTPPNNPLPPEPDDRPTAVDDAATVAEDSGATAIDVLGNDTDPDGGPKTIASKTNGANGNVVITGGGTGLTYQPNANYCNQPPGTTADTFTYTLNGGSTATVAVTVNCVNDAPTAVNDSAAVNEDSGANAITVLANDTDPDGGTKTITAKTNGASGAVVITGGGTGLTYAPNAGYCNQPPGTTADTFTYTLNGGSTATVSVTVNCANDAPVVNPGAGSPAYTEGGLAVNVAPTLTITDADSGGMSGATVTISAGSSAGDRLNWTDNSANISATGMGTTTITFTGTATINDYVAALRGVTFDSTSDSPGGTARTVSFRVTDSGGAQSGAATKDVAVTPVADAPVVGGAGVINYTENDAATALAPNLTVTDVDSPVASATVTITNPQSGDQLLWTDNSASISGSGMGTATVTLTASPSVSPTVMRDALRTVLYNTIDATPDVTPRSVTFRVTDSGGAQSAVNAGSTVTVNVTAENDVPIVTGAGGAVAWTEGNPPVTLAPSLVLTDGDSNIASATVTVTNAQTGDALTWTDNSASINVAGSGTSALTLSGSATPAEYQAALREATFHSTSGTPSTTPRTVRFRATDAQGAMSALIDSANGNLTTVNVTAVP